MSYESFASDSGSICDIYIPRSRYPTITNQIFEMFMCRELGPNTTPASILHADYSVDCGETQAFRWTLGSILVIAWPFALPAMLFLMMFRVGVQLRAQEEDASAMFNFLIADYKPDYVSNCKQMLTLKNNNSTGQL